MKSKILLIFLLMTLTFSAFPQTGQEVLTNQKIIGLVKLGLGEEVIIEKIRHSECKCDTSTDALTKLKAAKVSDNIILAMMNTDKAGGDSKSESEDSRKSGSKITNSGLKQIDQISEPGIYLFQDGKMQAIEPTVFSGTKANFLKGALTYGIMKSKFKAKVRQNSANLKAGKDPIFYFVFNPDYKNSGVTMAGGWYGMPATSPAEFVMVQMKVKKASREAVIGEYGAFSGVSTGVRDEDIREYSFEKIRTGVYKVTPKASLSPGEYCFYYAGNVTGLGFAGGKVFDFSVQ